MQIRSINNTPTYNYKKVPSKIAFKALEKDVYSFDAINDDNYSVFFQNPMRPMAGRVYPEDFLSTEEVLDFLKTRARITSKNGEKKKLSKQYLDNFSHLAELKDKDGNLIFKRNIRTLQEEDEKTRSYDFVQIALLVNRRGEESNNALKHILQDAIEKKISPLDLKKLIFAMYSKELSPKTVLDLSSSGYDIEQIQDEEEKNKLQQMRALKPKAKDFFIRMNGFGKDEAWGEGMSDLAELVGLMVKNNETFKTVLEKLSQEAYEFNSNYFPDYNREDLARDYALERKNYILKTGFSTEAGEKYFEYSHKFIKMYDKNKRNSKPKEEYKDTPVTKICVFGYGSFEDVQKGIEYGEMLHPSALTLDKSKEYMTKLYDELIEYKKEIEATDKEVDLDFINSKISQIHWLFAQSVPYMRGSDSLANVLIRGIYLAFGIKTSEIKEGKSFDLEAFSTDMEKFEEEYPNLFEIPPYKVD